MNLIAALLTLGSASGCALLALPLALLGGDEPAPKGKPLPAARPVVLRLDRPDFLPILMTPVFTPDGRTVTAYLLDAEAHANLQENLRRLDAYVHALELSGGR